VTYESNSIPKIRPRKTWSGMLLRRSGIICRIFWPRSILAAGPVADIEEGYISTASCILANLAMKTGRTLLWDAGKQQVVGGRRGEPVADSAVSASLGASGVIVGQASGLSGQVGDLPHGGLANSGPNAIRNRSRQWCTTRSLCNGFDTMPSCLYL